MNADTVKKMLPVIIAFANRIPIQFRDRRKSDDWLTLNPDTTEFRINEFHPEEWRVKPGHCWTCGSTNIESGYGLAGGGCGAYMYCSDCSTILDKTQDAELKEKTDD